MSKGLLITGATGNQGGAVVDALVSSPSSTNDFTILAVTRNPTSPAAQRLASLSPNIKLVRGDLNDAPSLLTAAKALHSNIWGVFSVQTPMGKGGVNTEEVQGKALVDAALAAGVKHFVYTSVDRGGDASFTNPTDVPHFLSKHNIEQHLVNSTKGTDMRYTILRPVAFMENFTPSFFGKVFGAAWRTTLPADQGMQLVSVRDVGHFAAQAFRNPDTWAGKGISLAGDEVTFKQAGEVFRAKAGVPLPETFGIFGRGLMGGYKADIAGLRRQHPGLLSLGEYLEKHSAWAKKE
ncbi:hypothetical protein KVT40_008047 [Elsinoe batatas]|uniref:NmrA-like domain-containing protein n=1 Tax=Elsinoe batatas TaxID=2601811 RepID=A0A8K0PB64_9PEZI|nr:hypothetical protein KVT40_008047 [Elsinoe batatas]